MSLRQALLPTVAAVALAAAATGCSSSGESADTAQVAAGFYPLAWVAEQVGGDAVEVSNLTRPGKDAHASELSIHSTAALAQADLVILSGGFQAEIDSSAKANAAGAVLDVADVVDFMPTEDAHAHEGESHDDHAHGEDSHGAGSHDGHDHGDTDPHFWLDPLRMAQVAEATAEELAEISPEHAATFRDNAAALVAELEQLDADYTSGLANCTTRTVVVSHDAFGYLARYGLDFEPVAGLSPGAEPTPGDLKHLAEVIEEEKLTTVFTETLAPTKLTDQLAADAGITTAVLDPVEGLVSADSEGDYLSLMRANLAALTKANRC